MTEQKIEEVIVIVLVLQKIKRGWLHEFEVEIIRLFSE